MYSIIVPSGPGALLVKFFNEIIELLVCDMDFNVYTFNINLSKFFLRGGYDLLTCIYNKFY